MTLNKREALEVSAQFDTVAGIVEKRASVFGIPADIAADFVKRADFVSGIIEHHAGISRNAGGELLDDQGNVVAKQADWPAEEIGKEKAGPDVQEGDEPYMRGEFTQQENRELRDLQESGKMPSVQTEERAPAPGKQATALDQSLARLAKIANHGEIHSIGNTATNLRMCAARLKQSGVEGVGGLVTGVGKLAAGLEGIQKRLIDAGDYGALVDGEADKALGAAQEVLPYLEDMSLSLGPVRAGSSPTAQLEAEELVNSSSGKLAKLVQYASRIVDKCNSVIGTTLKANDED